MLIDDKNIKYLYTYKQDNLRFKNKNPLVGNMFIPLVNDSQSVIDIMTSSFLNSTCTKNYYFPQWVDLHIENNNSLKLGRFNCKDEQDVEYKVIEQKYKGINTKQMINSFGGKNVFLDYTFGFNKFESMCKMSGKNRIKAKLDLMFNGSDIQHLKGDLYSKFYYIIPTDGIKFTGSLGYDTTNILELIYNGFKNKLINLPINSTLIFVNLKNMVYFFTGNVDTNDLNKFRSLLSAYSKFTVENLTNLSPEEKTLLGIDVNDTGNLVNNNQTSPVNNVSSELSNTIKYNLGVGTTYNASGNDEETAVIIDRVVNNVVQNTDNEVDAFEEINKNQDVLELLDKAQSNKLQGKKALVQDKYLEKLKANQSEVKYGNKTLEEIINEYTDRAIVEERFDNIDTMNDELKVCRVKDLDNSYLKKQFEKDTLKILTAFNNDKDVPLYVRNIEKEDTSDEFNRKDTITVHFEDPRHVKHTVKFDFPQIIDGKFMKLNGGKKEMKKQLILLPICKTKPDTVQITTNYNKVFVTRFGQNTLHEVQKMQKFLSSADNLKAFGLDKKVKLIKGDFRKTNDKTNALEYTEYASLFESISIGKTAHFNFNDKKYTILSDKDRGLKVIGSCISYQGNIEQRLDADEVLCPVLKPKECVSITDAIFRCLLEEVPEDKKDDLSDAIFGTKIGSRFAYSRVSLSNQKVPMVVLLGFHEGLEVIMRRYNVEYLFSEKRDTAMGRTQGKSAIRFKNGYLYYDSSKIENQLLMNGLLAVPTEEYEFAMFNEKEVYFDLFENLLGSSRQGLGFNNFISLFIDSITKDLLRDMKLPDDFTGVLLYANSMLRDNTFQKQNDLRNYRIRGMELLNVHLYKVLANSYRNYKDAARAGNKDMRVNIPQNAVINEILESQLVNEYSTLSPYLEIEEMGSATYKGPAGLNLDEALDASIREYDASMIGTIAMNGPYSDKIGVVRQLTYNPKIASIRGHIEQDIDLKDVKATNLCSPAELLSPYTVLHADPPRVAMQVTQSKHAIPTNDAHPALIRSGAEVAIPQIISNDFVFKAEDDGVVEKLDLANEYMIIRYKEGNKKVAVDLSAKSSKNSNGGFYITNKKDPAVKKGDKFKKGDILAKNTQYFYGDKENTSFMPGRLTLVAMHSGWYTYEDTCLITRGLSSAMGTYITMNKELKLGKNTNLEYIAKKGQKINSGEPLAIFESHFDEEEANKLLDRLGTEFKQTISKMGKNSIKSKYTGEIVDVVLTYNHDIEEYSPSLQKLIKSYKTGIEAKKKLVAKDVGGKAESSGIEFPHTDKSTATAGKLRGLDGIMIEFTIKYKDDMFIGDKVTYSAAVKTIVADVVEEEDAPYCEGDENTKIQAVFSPLSVVSRLTEDVLYQGWGNLVLMGLKKKVLEIYKK